MARFYRTFIPARQNYTIWWILLYTGAPPAVVVIASKMLLGMGM